MKLSVVILNYNVRWFLQQCVDSVVKALHELDAEIIVVDNASPDDSVSMLKAVFPQVRLIENADNAGFPKGNNKGVEAATGEWLCILNPDTVVPENLFRNLLEFVSAKTSIGAVGARLVDGTGHFLPESKRMLPTPMVAFGRMTGLYKWFPETFGHYYAPHVSPTSIGRVDVLVGAFLFLRTEDYRALGGFDERFFMYGEDIDLSYRLQLTGKANYFFGHATVLHYKGESTLKDIRYARRFADAMTLFHQKHFRVPAPVAALYSLGIRLFARYKFRKAAYHPVQIPQGYLVVTDKKEVSERIRLKTQKNAMQVAFEDVKSVISQTFSLATPLEVWLDVEYIGYERAIGFLEAWKDKGLTFKFLHPTEGYAIGSDSSEGRGTVLHF